MLEIVNTMYSRPLEAVPVLEEFVKAYLTYELMTEPNLQQAVGGFEPF